MTDDQTGFVEPQIIHGDARNLPIPDASADLVVTSPPYLGLRTYRDRDTAYQGQLGAEHTPGEYVENLIACTREMIRVLKPSGSIFVNLGDKYSGYNNRSGKGRSLGAARAVARVPDGGNPHPLRRTSQVIDRPAVALRPALHRRPRTTTSMKPKSTVPRVRPSTRVAECQARSGPPHRNRYRYPNASVSSTTQPSPSTGPHVSFWAGRRDVSARLSARSSSCPGHPRPGHLAPADTSRPGTGPRTRPDRRPPHALRAAGLSDTPRAIDTQQRSAMGHGHAAGRLVAEARTVLGGCAREFLLSLATEFANACDCADATAPSGPGVVLDPFGGTGTTALAAAVHGRHAISIDASRDYRRLATWRVRDARQQARARGTPRNPFRVPRDTGRCDANGMCRPTRSGPPFLTYRRYAPRPAARRQKPVHQLSRGHQRWRGKPNVATTRPDAWLLTNRRSWSPKSAPWRALRLGDWPHNKHESYGR